MTEHVQPERLSFEQAVAFACATGKAAFAAAPVFGDHDQERAEGVRVFVIEGDGQGGCKVRFIAGPFFSGALAANEILDDDITDAVRELLFMPTSFSEEWLSEQIQVLIGRLVQAAQIVAPEMPNYLDAKTRAAAPEVTFPIRSIGRAPPRGDKS